MSERLARALTGKVTKWVVLVLWVAVVAAFLVLGLPGKFSGAEKNDTSSWLPGSAESAQALNRLSVFQSPNELPTVVVYQRSSGITAHDLAKARADARTFQGLDGVNGTVQGPIPSADGQALQLIVPLDLGSNGWQKATTLVAKMRSQADSGDPGLSAFITGPGGNAADSGEAFKGIDGTLLYSTIAVVVVILLLTYRSPVLWLLPVVSAGVALAVAEGVVYLLIEHQGLTVNAQSAGILTVLVFGAGTDYALLLVARYREELRRHADRHEAMALALRRASPAVLASACTVISGMLCLLLAEMNSTKGMGPVAAIGVAVGLIVMLTLLPALLVICGRWVFWPKRPILGSAEPTTTGLWARIGQRIAAQPRAVWITTTLVLGAACLGVLQLNASGLSTSQQYTTTMPSVTGQQVLARHFPAGASDPAQIVARARSADRVAAAARVKGIAQVSPPTVRSGTALITATLADPPLSSAAYDTIDALRASVHRVPGADAEVTGTTAIQLDVHRASQHDDELLIPIILLVVLIILMLLLRAVIGPVVLIATVVLSFGAALGLSALVFRHVFGFAGADNSLPLFVFVFLVALGIDYNIFLMTRVREETLRHGPRTGALTGLAATGGVITSAGLVLAGTFAVLATLPLVVFAEIGFAVALGVLLDTIIVRSVLVTALNLDLGRWMWWPGRLSEAGEEGGSEPVGESEAALVG